MRALVVMPVGTQRGGAEQQLQHLVDHRALAGLSEDDRHLVQIGALRRAPAALAGDDLVALMLAANRAHHERLQQAALRVPAHHPEREERGQHRTEEQSGEHRHPEDGGDHAPDQHR